MKEFTIQIGTHAKIRYISSLKKYIYILIDESFSKIFFQMKIAHIAVYTYPDEISWKNC